MLGRGKWSITHRVPGTASRLARAMNGHVICRAVALVKVKTKGTYLDSRKPKEVRVN